MSVAMQMAQLHTQFCEKTVKNTAKYPLMAHDEQWPSPCEFGEVDAQGNIQWKSALQTPAGSLSDLASRKIININNSNDNLNLILNEFSTSPLYKDQIINTNQNISSIIIYLKDPGSPVLIRDSLDKNSFHVVMPMKI